MVELVRAGGGKAAVVGLSLGRENGLGQSTVPDERYGYNRTYEHYRECGRVVSPGKGR